MYYLVEIRKNFVKNSSMKKKRDQHLFSDYAS